MVISLIHFLLTNSIRLVRLHKDRLCDASAFFRSAFNSDFKEGSEQSMELLEEKVDIFEACARWLYLGDHKLGMPKESSMQVLRDYVDLFLLADRYQLSGLKGKYRHSSDCSFDSVSMCRTNFAEILWITHGQQHDCS